MAAARLVMCVRACHHIRAQPSVYRRLPYALTKLNDVTVPAQTPISKKDMVFNSMTGSVIFNAIDLTDNFYQLLMRPSDITLTAVSTPSGMLWE